jgi:CheY-like chemotaxis protein
VTTAPIRRARLREAVSGALGSQDPALPRPADLIAGSTRRAPADPPMGGQEAPGRGTDQPAVAMTVLYVDDSPTIRGLAERILSKDPAITVLTAADADTGLRLAVAHQPDLILLDLQLPGAHGESLIGELRGAERTSAIPIIVVSGDTSPATVKRLAGLGVTSYLAKPFDAEHLRAVVAMATQQGSPAALIG